MKVLLRIYYIWNQYNIINWLSVQSLSHVQLFSTLWTAACQAFLSTINSWSLLKLMSMELVMPSNHLILRHPLLLLHSICPSIGVFSSESVLHSRWLKYWSYSFSINYTLIKNELIWMVLEKLIGVTCMKIRNSIWSKQHGSTDKISVFWRPKCS